MTPSVAKVAGTPRAAMTRAAKGLMISAPAP
jgi:hypothetical protein